MWRRPVHIQARIKDDMTLFTCEDGEAVKQQKIKDDLPQPAHTSIK
jgi:hypothetical protein